MHRQGQRQFQAETAALAGLGFMTEITAEQIDQLPADRQANAQTAVLAGHRTIQLLKALIQLAVRRCGKAYTAINHLNTQRQNIAGRTATADSYTHLAMQGELDGVIQQTAKALHQLAGIALQGVRQAVIQLQDKAQPFVFGARRVMRTQSVEQPAQAKRLTPRVQTSSLQFGEGENVIDHAHHVAG